MKKKSILLIGVGKFGRYIAEKLNELGHAIMAVDCNEQRVNDIDKAQAHTIYKLSRVIGCAMEDLLETPME